MSRFDTYVLAEAGVNHNGSLSTAMELLEAAADAGADGIKFQTFKASALVTPGADMASYQKQNTGRTESQLAMLSRLELSYEDHVSLSRRADSLGLQFLSTAFDADSLDFLATKLEVPTLKIASGEVTNGPLLLSHARYNRDIILSTGMATLAEIEQALAVLAFGWMQKEDAVPTLEGLRQAYVNKEMQQLLHERVTVLHCTTQYPTPPEDVNLRAMDTLRAAFALKVGYSDHTMGITVPVAAVARGASMIEKHFTLDRSMEGPDHAASLEPGELKAMVEAIRTVEAALGSSFKGPCEDELEISRAARKSLVAAAEISAGEAFDESNVTAKRPGTGLSPMTFWQLAGTRAHRSYQPGELIVD